MTTKNDQGGEARIRPEYDFKGGERGKYADRFAQGTEVLALDAETSALYSMSEAFYKAMRTLTLTDAVDCHDDDQH